VIPGRRNTGEDVTARRFRLPVRRADRTNTFTGLTARLIRLIRLPKEFSVSQSTYEAVFGPGTVVAKNDASFAEMAFGPGTVVAKNDASFAEMAFGPGTVVAKPDPVFADAEFGVGTVVAKPDPVFTDAEFGVGTVVAKPDPVFTDGVRSAELVGA
jgi:hypothetical protein